MIDSKEALAEACSLYVAECRHGMVAVDGFQDLLTQAVDILGLNQRELADTCGVGASTISRWLSGQAQPMRRTRMAVIEELRSWAADELRGGGS